MNISKYSRNNILQTLKTWEVPKDFADPMFNYLVYGYSPGSCFTSVLANDFYGAIRSSHPGNTIQAFKALAGWVDDYVPKMAKGSYEAVKEWTELTDDLRRSILEAKGLVFSTEEESWKILKDEEESWKILKDDPVEEVHLY